VPALEARPRAVAAEGSGIVSLPGIRGTRLRWALALFYLTNPISHAQSGGAVCSNGFGQFQAAFSTGLSVWVGPAHARGFAQHSCEAALTWRGEQLVAVHSAAKVDIDVLGANLGFGEPVVAFEWWKSSEDWQSEYQIYSLGRDPHLLATITGGDEYRATDADFNRRVAIWTTDAAAVNGLDGLTYADYDAPPTVVLEFERGRLIDVSAWYRKQYDQQIAALRAQLTRAALVSFRQSDGRLAFGSAAVARWIQLRKTKVKVLEIVWAYLYSGRPRLAWAELNRDWPPADVARIQAEIVAARANGIDAQVTEMASAKLPPKWTNTSFISEYVREHAPQSSPQVPTMFGAAYSNIVERASSNDVSLQGAAADVAPKAIVVWRPAPSTGEVPQAERWETIMLTIDEAGKVHAAKMVDPSADPELVKAAMHWRFIPAFRDGKPVAYQLKFQVTPYR
jgi:hypothetical protein